MPATVSDHPDIDAAAQVRGLDSAAPDPPAMTTGAWESVRKYVISAAIWLLYVPHYSILWLLGPRLGIAWVRLTANIHWLTTFVGAQRSTRQALQRLHPLLGTELSVSAILRRHLQLKHECFARVRVYNLHGADGRLKDIEWQAHPSCVSSIPEMNDRERGLVVVGYHFGFFQLSAVSLSQVVPGCNPLQLRYRIARCAEQAMLPIARLVMRRAIEADRRSGAPIFYIDHDTSLLPLFRLLRKAGSISVAADGMFADDYIEVPFFDGRLRVPIGWARLAAATRSDILLLYDTQIDAHHRQGWFYSFAASADNSAAGIQSDVAEAIRVLETAIRKEPWAWHPWQRLRWVRGEDGSVRYHLRQFGADSPDISGDDWPPARAEREHATRFSGTFRSGKEHVGQRFSAANVSMGDGRPRVAIVCNSMTPYRTHLHERIVNEVPEIELWSLSTHTNAFNRWSRQGLPESLRPIDFSHGEPTNEQAQPRHSLREWRKGGRILEWLEEHDISAVFCQGCGDAGRLRILHDCYRRQVPCFLTGDFNICSDRFTGPKRWLKRAVYERAIGWSTGLMPCGARGTALFNRYGGSRKPQFLYPFVPDVRAFAEAPVESIDAIRQRFKLDPERRRIVFSARLMHVKRPDLALKAFAAIADDRPNWDLVMLGDGELRSSLVERVPASLRDRIQWTGFLHDMRDVAGLYAQSDVLLLPSDHEPWGVVVAEAAAAGLAIVASDVVGAAPELVHEGRNGHQFVAGDVQSLVRALRVSTAPDWIDEGKAQSRAVLHEWLAESDPVIGFRAALAFCRVITSGAAAPATNGKQAGSQRARDVLAAS
jgi:glycosyltransferase involved in cell wall biosynthesis/lauroyl/myristoyl acyltransferase